MYNLQVFLLVLFTFWTDTTKPGNRLVFLSEKASECLGVLGDEWLGESKAVHEKEPGAQLRDYEGAK